MRRFPLSRALSALLSLLIVASAPGYPAYNAAAQSIGAGASAEAGAAGRVVPAINAATLNSPIPSLNPSVLAGPALTLSAPAITPEARAIPVGALSVAVPAAVGAQAAVAQPAAAAAKAAEAMPTALTAAMPAASAPEKMAQTGAMFDGSSAKKVAELETPVFGGIGRALKKGLAILTLSAGMMLSQNAAQAQTVPHQGPPPVAQQAPLKKGGQNIPEALKKQIEEAIKQAQAAQQAQNGAQVAPPPANPAASDTVEARVELPRPIQAEASIDRQGVTVGERVHLTFTIKNTSDKPITLTNLRQGLQGSVPADLEIQGKEAEQPITLAPGESKTVTYEAIPFGTGTLTLDGGIAVVTVGEIAQYPEGIEIVLPKTTLEVKPTLTADWKKKGLRDIVGVQRGNGPNWMWLAAIPLGLLLLVGVKRLVAMRKLYPKLDANRISLLASTEAEIERLKAESENLDTKSFYARYQDLVTGFMVDFAGMPKAARDARTFHKDLAKSFYADGQSEVAARLAAQAEVARFSGNEKDVTERGRMLARLAALVESVAGKAGKEEAKPKNGGLNGLMPLALLPGAAGLTFGSPWVLALLIPYAAYVLWTWRASKAKTERFALSSAAQTPAKRTLRERFAGLPRVLRLAAVGLILVALARPMIGTQRSETFIPSTDTMVSIDLSGSMSGAKLEGVREAVKGYVEEQRRGTENRVGMVTFSDNSYLDVKLTTDYDALISHLKELQTTGSTAIGKSMLTAIAHFLELNALDLDGKADPRALEVQKLLRDQGLSAALAYAKQYPDLMAKILQPERAKIVVIFTDGDSNAGIKPEEAADIAAQLGVKVYGVGIAGPNEGFNEATLRTVAEKTGAKFYRAGDADGMRSVLLEISRLEKSPAKIVSSVSIKDYTSLLALLAFLMLGGELLLANTRLRTLYGMALVMGLSGTQVPMMEILGTRNPVAIEMTAQVNDPRPTTGSPTEKVPEEVIEGNKLYNQGRFAEALKKYGEAIERHPDVPEIYFNMADSYLRLGETAKAEAAWQKYLSLTQDAKKQSQTIFNLGNSALAAGDAEKAVELYKEALRRDASNMDAKWNLEALKQAQKEQEQKEGKQGKDSKKGQPGKQKGKPGDGKPGDGKPGDGKPGDGKPGDGKPGDGKPGDGKPGDGKPKPGEVKPNPDKGADKLGEALGEQEGKEKGEARKGITRKGSGVWGMAALPLAMAGHGLVFSSTAFLWAVGIGLPVLALLLAYGLKKRMDAAKKLSPGTAPKTFKSWWGARRFLGKSAIALAAAGLLGLAAGDPRGGMTDERVNFGGKDIVVTVDGSHSMVYAEDGRMERTQKELNDFITRLQGTDRVGLIVFAGQSRTASPISIDYGNFEFKINRLDVEARGLNEGSDLASAIKFSANHFETAKKLGDRQRILIVISDGDVDDKELAAAIAAAAEHRVTVYAIGVGKPEGTKIKVPTADGTGTEYIIDSKTGAPAITRLNEAPLRQLAERTGGAYFRADGKTSIDNILGEVSRLEKGHKGDSIKSPRPVGVWLLWPALALLLLDLLLPGRSLLKRASASVKPEAKDKPKTTGKGGALMGMALIPLGAWPQILPFVLLATAVAGYLAADSWTGGAVTRRIRETWQNWHGAVEKGVSKDLIHLYDLREADERRLAHFVKGWQESKESLRDTLITVAAHDEALWREKLTAVYLSGAAPETLEKILSALRRTSKTRLEPLKPITDRIAARKADISWMDHSVARERVAALEAAAAGQPLAFEAGAWVAPKPLGLWARVKRGGTVAILSLMIGLTAVSSIGTVKFQEEQRVAAEMSTKLFYSEDLFIFTDRYVDSRIPEQVLPALKRWTESPKTAGSDFERALTILRESPDPKADNILIAIFRRAGVLPLTGKGESIMLLTLIERDNDAVWESMDQLIATSRSDEASARLLVKLVVLGVESGNEKAITQMFRVLKSPNKQVQQAAAGILYAHLSRDDGKKFYDNLLVVQAKHANDPMLQLWTASFAFRRLAEPNVTEADLVKAKAFLDVSLTNARRLDGVRAAIYAQTPPDQEVQAPPSMVAMLLNIADRMQGDGNAPAPLSGAARYFVTKATTALIQDAEKLIPGLHERLIKDGVVLPDTQNSYGGYGDEYDDYHGHGGWFGGRGGGSSVTQSNYRDAYKLAHLEALGKAIAEMGAPLAGEPTKENAALRELLDRVEPTLEKAFETGVKAGMLQGGSAGEIAAEQLLPDLRAGEAAFTNHAFLRVLRENGLAPSVGDYSGTLAYPESLSADQLAQLHGLLAGIVASGKGWDYEGKPRDLTWSEKLYLVNILDKVQAARLKNFPEAPALATANLESLSLAKLSLEITAHPKDAEFALAAEKILIEKLAKGPVDAADAGQVITQILGVVAGTEREAAALASLSVALKGPNGAALAPAARARANAGMIKIAEAAEKAFSVQNLKDELVAAGVREGTYGWRSDLKLRHYRATAEAITTAADKAKAGGPLKPEQTAALGSVKTLAGLESLAAAAGAPSGDSPAEIAADKINGTLLEGYRLFSGASFNEALRASNLMPGKGNTMADYQQSYTLAEAQAIRAWLKAIVLSGQGWDGNAARKPLTWDEKIYLAKALDRVDAAIAKLGGPAATVSASLLDSVLRPGEENLAMARLAFAVEARPRDHAFALSAQETLIKLAARGVDTANAGGVLIRVRDVLRGSSDEAKATAALADALKTTPSLKDAAKKEADLTILALAEQGEAAFGDSFKKAITRSGLRESEYAWRSEFKLRHYAALLKAVNAAAAKAQASGKPLNAAQKAAVARARSVLPALETMGVAAGVTPGDSPADAAAEILNPALQAGYAKFPGSVFNDKLKEKGFMDQNAGTSVGDHQQAYTRVEVAAIRAWLKATLDSGQGWESDGTAKALEDDEKEILRDAIAAADEALAGFDAPKKLHGFAPLMLTAALPALAPWMLFTVLGLASAYLIWKLLASKEDVSSEPEAREAIPGVILSRHRRIELVARRMATAVNGGAFRSRFIGAGGTDFAEARPYAGEDRRDVDWKTSAKKDELFVKKFELERDMPLMLVIDVSRSGRFGTRGADKRTAIEDAAAVLALAAAHSNIRVGAVFISDRVEQVFPARGGSRHAMTIIDAMLKAEPSGTSTDLKPGLMTAGKLLGARSMVAVLSDFIAPDFKDALGSLAARHDVRAIRVTDPAELSPLPDVGLLPVVDAETGVTRMLDTSSRAGRAEAASNVSRREAAVEAAFEASHITPISISTEGDPLETLEQSFHPKAKQPFKP